eukprot:Opistho-2@23993
MEDGVGAPAPKHARVEPRICLSNRVELGYFHEHFCADIAIKHADGKRRKDGEQHIVECEEPLVEQDLPRESVRHGKPKLDKIKGDVLVKAEQNDFAQSRIRPRAMDEKKSLEEAKLRNRIVRRPRRLQSLLSTDPHSDMCSLNHTDVIGAVANSECDRPRVIAHQPHNLRLLQRRHATTNDGTARVCETQKVLLDVVVQRVQERVAVDYERKFLTLRTNNVLELSQLPENVISRCIFCRFVASEERHSFGQQFARKANVDGCFLFVTRQYPYLNARVRQVLDCFGNAILEFIFDCRGTKKKEIGFYFFGRFIHQFLSVLNRDARSVIPFCPLLVPLLIQFCDSQAQSAETLVGEFLEMAVSRFRKGLNRRESLVDDGVCALAIQLQTAIGALYYYRHPLAGAVELKHVHHLICLFPPQRIDYH